MTRCWNCWRASRRAEKGRGEFTTDNRGALPFQMERQWSGGMRGRAVAKIFHRPVEEGFLGFPGGFTERRLGVGEQQLLIPRRHPPMKLGALPEPVGKTGKPRVTPEPRGRGDGLQDRHSRAFGACARGWNCFGRQRGCSKEANPALKSGNGQRT